MLIISRILKGIEDFRFVVGEVERRAELYRIAPVKNQPNLTHEEIRELEVLHYNLGAALYTLRFGKVDEMLKKGEIDLVEWSKMTEKINSPYSTI